MAICSKSKGFALDTVVEAAGVIFLTPEGLMLFVKRSGSGDHGGEWAIPGGTVEPGESMIEAAFRECREELGGDFPEDGAILPLTRATSDEGVDFMTYVDAISEEFQPDINDEHDDYVWADPSDPPQPLHPALQPALDMLNEMFDTLGQDDDLAQDDFNPQEARETDGKWTAGAGSGAGVGKNTNNAGESKEPPKFQLEPKAIDVGGDDWNKKTAVRLETEYRSKKGELDKLADGFVLTDEQAEKQRPKSWAELNDYQKDMTETDWKQANFQKVKGEVAPLNVLQKQWGALSDEQKYAEAKSQGKLDLSDRAPPIVMPKHIDPLNTTDGEDYRQTQRLAAKLAITRAMDLIKQRGIKSLRMGAGDVTESNLSATDKALWSGWKAASTNLDGLLIQMAVADELGAHLRDETLESAGETREGLMRDCDEGYSQIGGYEGFKALIRAKWETTQWLLDKAGVHDLNLYRGIDLPDVVGRYDPKASTRREAAVTKWLRDKIGDAASNVIIGGKGGSPVSAYLPGIARRIYEHANNPDTNASFDLTIPDQITHNFVKEIREPVLAAIKGMPAADIMKIATAGEPPPDPDDPGLTKDVTDARGNTYQFLPNVQVKRNGAASTSTDKDVSNHWDGESGRVVLRAHVPRTACVSVPAYGQNVHSEHEVVVAGAAWKGWDAFKGRAPSFDDIPLGGG